MPLDQAALRVAWSGDLEGNQELFAGVQRANQVLEEELGRSTELVSADWRLIRNSQDRPLLELTLTDLFTRSQVLEKFDAGEFRSKAHLADRIHQMWHNLLSARTEGQIRKLKELGDLDEGV